MQIATRNFFTSTSRVYLLAATCACNRPHRLHLLNHDMHRNCINVQVEHSSKIATRSRSLTTNNGLNFFSAPGTWILTWLLSVKVHKEFRVTARSLQLTPLFLTPIPSLSNSSFSSPLPVLLSWPLQCLSIAVSVYPIL